MSRPITWRNVAAGNTDGAVRNFLTAGQQLGNAVSGLGNVVQEGAQDWADAETKAFINDLQNAPDEATRDAMVANASKAFLNLDQVTAAQKDLVQQDRATTRFGWESDKEAHLAALRPGQVEQQGLALREGRVKANVAEATEDDQINSSKYNLQNLEADAYVAGATKDTRVESAKQALTNSKDSNRRANTKFQNAQDDRNRKLEGERVGNQTIGSLRATANPLQRFTDAANSLTSFRQNNKKVTPEQMAQIEAMMVRDSALLNPQQYGVPVDQYAQQILALGNSPKKGDLDTITAQMRRDIGTAFPDLKPAAINAIASNALSQVPGYSNLAARAGVENEVLQKRLQAEVKARADSDAWKEELKNSDRIGGQDNVIRRFIRAENGVGISAGQIDDEDLTADIQAMRTTLNKIYPKSTNTEISNIIMKLSGVSATDSFLFGNYSDMQLELPDGKMNWNEIDTNPERNQLKEFVDKLMNP